MMKRRWSNNGGFALRMLEESSSEVTSSSAGLVMAGPGGMTMSPTSLGSSEYGELELWYDEAAYNQHSGSASGVGTGCVTAQTTVIPLPSMQTTINHTPRSASASSISSGIYLDFFLKKL